jgi:hypothetical protein
MSSNRRESERYEFLRDIYNDLNHRSHLLRNLQNDQAIPDEALGELWSKVEETRQLLGDATVRAKNARSHYRWRASKDALRAGLVAIRSFLEFVEVQFAFDVIFEQYSLTEPQGAALKDWVHEVFESIKLIESVEVS